jgi:hypothetical protein
MILAEKIDPWPVRRMATLDFTWGRHTFPVEEGAPIVLDPRATYEELVQAVPPEERTPTRNAGRVHEISRSRTRVPSTTRRLFPAGGPDFAGRPPAALPPAAAPIEMPLPEFPVGEMPPWALPPGAVPPWGMAPSAVPPWAMPLSAVPPWTMPPWAVPNGLPIAIDVLDALNFTNMLAQQGAISFRNGPSQAYRARNAIQDIVSHGIAPTEPRMLDAIGWFFSIAEKIARSYGARALTIVRTTALAVSDLIDDVLAQQQSGARNLSFESGGKTFQVPSWLSGVGALAGKIGLNIGALALAPKLAALGITGPMLELVEQELNAEGLSLGPLANPKRSFASALSSMASKRTE